MSEQFTVITLFPGQGAFDGAALVAAHQKYPQVRRVFEEIDKVSHEFFSRSLTEVLFGDSTPEMEKLLADDAWVSQLAIYGSSAAAWQILVDNGVRSDVLVGHSLGEIAALVAAGAFSVADGARIVAHRVQVIEQQNVVTGRMAALSSDGERVRKIIELIDDEFLSVATENHDTQTVVSGTQGAMEKLLGIAKHLGIPSVGIASPFPFHTPILAPAVPVFADRVRRLEQHPLQRPVYSPVLGRYYEPGDVLADLLAEHFIRPVKFNSAVRHLADGRALRFVEVGGKATLGKLVGKVLNGETQVSTWSTMSVDRDGRLALEKCLDALGTAIALDADKAELFARVFAPDAEPSEFSEFWAEFGAQIIRAGEERLREFRALRVENGTAKDEAAAPKKTVVERGAVGETIRAIYATALEYPEEVFTEDVLLEAELGVDSVKQVELLTRVSEHYGLPPRDSGFRLAEIDTMGKVIDFFATHLTDSDAPDVVREAPSASEVVERGAVGETIRAIYATALEYPEEVFTEDVLLEAELGVDSVKQVELLTRVSEHYGLPPRDSGFRLAEIDTMGKVIDFFAAHLETGASEVAVAA
ncbi:acyltransferase domain-containing protein [Streptomyces sp. NPDC006140]|uniref:acyltransferase domain-containing protein n=1 Tax=Streptomyces sp. NPDC006140 TaxID=3154579 RepID=UPI0033FC3CE1